MDKPKVEIDINDLTVSYGNICVLDSINLTCKKGEFVSIIGKSGTGKTSLLNSIANFIPYKGEIKVHGSIGYIFQHYSLFPWFTVQENIAFGLEDISKEKKQKVVEDLLDIIGMSNVGDRYPNQLSGGQIQRVALARSFAKSPDIILADEPYGALDNYTRDKMHEWLLNILFHSPKTVLFVTHNLEEAIFLSNRIIVINDKKIVANLTVPFEHPRSNSIKNAKDFLDFKHKVMESMNDNNPKSF